MSATLVKGRHVVCRVRSRDAVDIVEDGAVLVRDGDIAAVGPAVELERAGGFDRVIGGPDHVVFPGFVNAHHHVGLTPLQLGAPDLPLELWIVRRIGGKVVDPYLDTLYSAFEMIRSGVTTVQHLHGRAAAPIENVHGAANAVIRAYRDLGMRVSYSYGVRDQNRVVYEADDDFLKRLPADMCTELESFLATQTIPLEDSIGLFSALTSEHAGASTVAIQLAPVNFHWCSDAALARVGEVSRSLRVPMHMHLVETAYQKSYARKRTGGSAVRRLREAGLLNPLMTLGHGVWMTDDDLDLIAAAGARICHNCSSNMRLRSGLAPLNAMTSRGIEVAIGIDEAGLNDDRDMLQEMRLVLRAHRVPGMSDDVPSAAEVFRMATEHGARTTGFGNRIGAIEAGRAADLVLLDWRDVAYPYLDSDVPLVDALVQRARARGVDTVMIDGELVLEDGEFTRLDERAALDELARSLDRPATDEEHRLRAMAKRLLPHVERFYAGYLDWPSTEPHYRMNSKI